MVLWLCCAIGEDEWAGGGVTGVGVVGEVIVCDV